MHQVDISYRSKSITVIRKDRIRNANAVSFEPFSFQTYLAQEEKSDDIGKENRDMKSDRRDEWVCGTVATK